MDNIFLTPDATFSISIKTKEARGGALKFSVVDGGPYKFRTATGREYGKLQRAFSELDIDSAFRMLSAFLVDGIPAEKVESLHPDVVWTVLLEVLNRSRVSDVDRGK